MFRLVWYCVWVCVAIRLVARAEGAGYRALVLTVDAPVLGRREADVRNRFALPDHMQLENFSDPSQGATMGQAEGNSVRQLIYREKEEGDGFLGGMVCDWGCVVCRVWRPTWRRMWMPACSGAT
jgi:hypothetical protein